MIELTPRLKAVADLVIRNKVLVDVGTDHAYIPIYLLQTGVITSAIATDIHQGPYEIAKDKVRAHLLEKAIQVRKGDGLTPLKENEAEVAVIAGMGGLTINQILSQSPKIVLGLQQLILQPMTAADQVRKWLSNNQWKIQDEVFVKEGQRYYQVISAVRGIQNWPTDTESIQWLLGEKLITKCDHILLEYVDKLVTTNKKLLQELQEEPSAKAQERIEQLKAETRKLKEVLQLCQ